MTDATTTPAGPSRPTAPAPQAGRRTATRVKLLGGLLATSLAVGAGFVLVNANAATVTLTPTADTFVSQGAPNANNGGAQYLRSLKSSTGAFKSYLAFDLTGVSGTITGASLQLYARSTQTATYTVSNTGAFTESTVTWATAPALGTTVKTFSNSKLGTWNTVDVTPAAKAGQVMYLAISGGNAKTSDWDAREATNKPKLTLTIADPTTTTTAPPVTYALAYSTTATRTAPVALSGATVSGTIYPFTTPDTNVQSVAFTLDGTAVRTEGIAPFDFAGTAGTGLATDPSNPWDTTTVTNGAHTIGASFTMTDGTTKTASAAFTVSNTTTTTTTPPTTTTTPPTTTFDPNRFSGVLGIGQSNSYTLEALNATGTKVSYPAKGLTDAMADAANTHAKLVRMEWMLPGNGGASTLTATQLAGLDARFQAAKANGLGVVLLVDYTPSDLWNQAYAGSPYAYPSSGHTFPRDPAMQDKYVARTMAMVEHLQAAYPGVLVALEDQNEPNGWEFGSAAATTPFRPVDYVSLLKKMHDALKASNAKFPALAPVLHLTGGPSTGTTNNTNGTSTGTPTDFFKSMAAATNTLNGATHYGWYNALKDAGAMPGTHFDHITGHFYDKTIDSNYSMNFDKIWNVWAGPQVWATEQSKSVNSYFGADGEYTPSPANQATWLSNNFALWAGKGAKAGAWIQFCDFDRNTGLDETTITSATVAATWGDKFGFYGLRDGTGTAYPSFAVFAGKNGHV